MSTNRMELNQEAAIIALMSGDYGDAAKAAKVTKQTIYRWMKDENFRAAFREAKRDAVSNSIAHLQASTSKAVTTLTDVMNDKETPASAKIQAAKTVLEYAYKGIELEDLEARIQELERIANEHKD